MTEQKMLTQQAPYPVDLQNLVDNLVLDPGWKIWLQDMRRDEDHGRGEGRGLTLVIQCKVFDSYHPERGREYKVNHFFIVPAATYNRQSWRRWLFEQYIKVLTHEGMETFKIRLGECNCRGITLTNPSLPEEEIPHAEGCASETYERPYAPNHGPGEDPYVVRELTTDEARRTQFTGKIDHKY